MSNVEKMWQKPFSGKDGGTEEILLEYRSTKRLEDEAEARLEEYCSAIEDFGLDMPGRAAARQNIFCREKSYTAAQVLAQAASEAANLEKLTEQANAARGRVLTRILRRSKNLAEYRAMRWLYVDSAEETQRAVDVFPAVQGHVS